MEMNRVLVVENKTNTRKVRAAIEEEELKMCDLDYPPSTILIFEKFRCSLVGRGNPCLVGFGLKWKQKEHW